MPTSCARATRSVFERGTQPTLTHVPCEDGEPGELVKVWAIARLKDGACQIKVMNRREVEAIKKRSSAVRSGHESPWDSDVEWMWKKTCLKQLCKLLPMSVETQRAVDLDDRAEVDLPQDLVMLADEQEPPTAADEAPERPMPQRRSEPAPAAATVATNQPSGALRVTAVVTKDHPGVPYYVVELTSGEKLSTS